MTNADREVIRGRRRLAGAVARGCAACLVLLLAAALSAWACVALARAVTLGVLMLALLACG